MSGGRPLAFNSVDELEQKIDDYFANHAIKTSGDVEVYAPTMSGLAYHLDICTETLRNYGKKEEFFGAIKRAKQRVEMALEERLYGQSVTGVIFNLKCNHQWNDGDKEESTDMAAALLALANRLPD